MIFSTLVLTKDVPIYEQIQKHIEVAIESGTLTKDSKLPSTREASSVLGVSRNTVLLAYEGLESRGILYSVKGKGSFIKEGATIAEDSVAINWADQLSRYAKTCNAMDIIKSESPYHPGMISFKSIAPKGSLFDIEEFKRAFLDMIALEGEKILNYGYAKGYRPLIDYLLHYMEEKGVEVEGKDILITNGFTEALDILLATYTKPGDVILSEQPTHHTSIKMMKAYGLEVIGIQMDDQGVQLEALELAIKQYQPRWVYLTPSYQNPTGIVMSGERRKHVYDLLSSYQIPCIEDGFNEELVYSGSHVRPIAALSRGSNHILYLGSLSKILFPGLRIGWILADKDCINQLESVKRARNIHSSFLDQAVFVQYMRSGAFERYLKKIKKYYKEQYTWMSEKVSAYLPYEKRWGEGGLHVYVDLPNQIDTRKLLEACYERGVIFMPGDLFRTDGAKTSSLRLGFTRLTDEEVERGLQIIAEEIGKMQAKSMSEKDAQ